MVVLGCAKCLWGISTWKELVCYAQVCLDIYRCRVDASAARLHSSNSWTWDFKVQEEYSHHLLGWCGIYSCIVENHIAQVGKVLATPCDVSGEHQLKNFPSFAEVLEYLGNIFKPDCLKGNCVQRAAYKPISRRIIREQRRSCSSFWIFSKILQMVWSSFGVCRPTTDGICSKYALWFFRNSVQNRRKGSTSLLMLSHVCPC